MSHAFFDEGPMEFAEVIACCRTLSVRIRARNCAFDGLVGVTRGGWVPARLMSSLLSVRRLYSIGLQYADTERKKLVCYDDPAHFIPPASTLLVVEDCLETGNALNFAKQHLSSKGHKVFTAALFVTRRSAIVPDFYVDCLDDPPGFPWELPDEPGA
jgi:hypoxanthine phosphoribosyltransferase